MAEIPNHWDAKPLKHITDFINGNAFKPSEWTETGTPIIRIENLNGSENFNHFQGKVDERYHVEKDDLLFGWSGNKGTSFGPFLWWKEGLCFLNQHIFKLSEFDCEKRWLYWTLKAVTYYVEEQTQGIIGMVHVTKGNLGGIKIPELSKNERSQVASFLDHETAKIDTLIEEQQSLIRLLQEKRQAVISHAVTKGLNPDAPMKDSGVEWLGKVPEHWGISALGYYAFLNTGATPDRSKQEFWNGSIPWIKTGEVKYDTIYQTEEFISEAALTESSVQLSPPGTLLMAMYGQGVTRGRVAILGVSATYNQACVAISPTHQVSNEYLRYFFMAAYHAIRDGGNETSQMNLNADIVRKFKIAIPTVEEQTLIIEFLNNELVQYDNLVKEANGAIELMQERRTALISAAVTGKIDVRDWTPTEQKQKAAV